MPRIVTELPQTYDNVIRPVTLEIARSLLRSLNLTTNVNVLLPGRAETTMLNGTTLEEANVVGDAAKFGHTERLMLEVTESPVEDRVLTTAVHIDEFTPFFMDKDLGVRMYPVYSGTELQFRFTYRGVSRTRARQLRNEILTRTAAMRETILHEMSYYYHVPYVFLHLLKEIHTLRENQGGYGDSWDKYIAEHISPRARIITDQIGNNQALVVAETQLQVQGAFDFISTVEEEQKDKESGTWLVEFGYKVTIDQPISAVAVWPLVIHNQLISDLWRSQPWASGDQLVDPDRRERFPSLSRYAFDHFSPILTNHCKASAIGGVISPNFDEWQPAHVTPNTSSVFTGMVLVNPDTLGIEIDLTGELDGYVFSDAVREFMRGEASFMTTRNASVFEVRLFRDSVPMHDETLTVSQDLVVRNTAPLDIRTPYHIRIALVNDLNMLGQAAQERFRQAGDAAVEILKALQWMTLGRAYIPTLLGGRVIRREDLRVVAQRINDLKVPHLSDVEYKMITVNNVLVVVHRREQDVASNEHAERTQESDAGAGSDPFTTEPECCS